MVDAADAPVLAVLTRAPSSRGKTRLFASLGVPPDPSLLAALLLDTLDGAAAAGVRRVVAVTPASACDAVREIVGDDQPFFQAGPLIDEPIAAEREGLWGVDARFCVEHQHRVRLYPRPS